jgi:hypothetical protein
MNSGLNSASAADQLQHVHKSPDFGKIVHRDFGGRSPALGTTAPGGYCCKSIFRVKRENIKDR